MPPADIIARQSDDEGYGLLATDDGTNFYRTVVIVDDKSILGIEFLLNQKHGQIESPCFDERGNCIKNGTAITRQGEPLSVNFVYSKHCALFYSLSRLVANSKQAVVATIPTAGTELKS